VDVSDFAGYSPGRRKATFLAIRGNLRPALFVQAPEEFTELTVLGLARVALCSGIVMLVLADCGSFRFAAMAPQRALVVERHKHGSFPAATASPTRQLRYFSDPASGEVYVFAVRR
jgi:hypothetical protein